MSSVSLEIGYVLCLIRITPDADVASRCHSFLVITVGMPLVCANLAVFRHKVSSVSLEIGCLVSLIRITPGADVASHCHSFLVITVGMPLVCANLTVFRHKVSSVSLEIGCVLCLIRITPDADVAILDRKGRTMRRSCRTTEDTSSYRNLDIPLFASFMAVVLEYSAIKTTCLPRKKTRSF